MTEDELIIMVAVLNKDLREKISSRTTSEAVLREIGESIARQNVIRSSLTQAMEHLMGAKIVVLSEYKSLVEGLKTTTLAFAELEKRRVQAAQKKMELDRAIPVLRDRLAELEKQLDSYEPPSKVLEFKRREQQRDPQPSGK